MPSFPRQSPSLTSLLPLVLLLSLTSCSSAPPKQPSLTWTRTTLYLGLTRMDSSLISDPDFQKFVDTTITPLFPDGFTLLPAAGQYLDSHHLLHREPSRLLIILYPTQNAPSINQKLNRLTTLYLLQFHQESILREDTPISAAFLTTP